MPIRHKRRLLAVPLLRFTRLANIGANPDGITRHAPGRTSQFLPAGTLPADDVLSLSAKQTVTLPFFALTEHYITILFRTCQDGTSGFTLL